MAWLSEPAWGSEKPEQKGMRPSFISAMHFSSCSSVPNSFIMSTWNMLVSAWIGPPRRQISSFTSMSVRLSTGVPPTDSGQPSRP